MNRFIALAAAGKFDEANKMLAEGRWIQDGQYIRFEAGDRKCSYFPVDWSRVFSESMIEHYTPKSLSGWLSGRREFGAKENVLLVTLKFEAGPRLVKFRELFAHHHEPELYKQAGIYGFSCRAISTDPLILEGRYTFADPDGGFVVLMVEGQERDRQPVCIGYNFIRLVYNEQVENDVRLRVLVTDKDGNIRNKLEKSVEQVFVTPAQRKVIEDLGL